MKLPDLIVEPGDPACQHVEKIIGGIGTCKKCGRVKDYNRLWYAQKAKLLRPSVNMTRISTDFSGPEKPKKKAAKKRGVQAQ